MADPLPFSQYTCPACEWPRQISGFSSADQIRWVCKNPDCDEAWVTLVEGGQRGGRSVTVAMEDAEVTETDDGVTFAVRAILPLTTDTTGSSAL